MLIIFIAPLASFAYAPSNSNNGLIPDCSPDPVTNQCGWGYKEFMGLINNVINFVLFKLALPIAALMFTYAGIKLVGSGGSTEARSSAKNIFTNTVIGLVLAAGSWLIVKTILFIAGYDGTWIGF